MHVVPLVQQNGDDEGQAKRFRPAAQVVSRCVIAEAVVKPKARAVKRKFRRDMVSEMRKEERKKAQIEYGDRGRYVQGVKRCCAWE
jgi:hypothetical protein